MLHHRTIDKDYPKRKGGYAFEICQPGAQAVLERAHPTFPFRVVTACREDSQDLTDQHRSAIVDTCRGADEKFILITHGTDTVLQTAAVIASQLFDVTPADVTRHAVKKLDGDVLSDDVKSKDVKKQGCDKVIVLTGAFLPERFKETDADFNVGLAVGAMQGGLGPGVYVALGGRVWRWDRVTRAEDGQYVSKV